MKEMGSREFQLNYQRLDEPVKVVAMTTNRRVIGYFYPGDVPPDQGKQSTFEMVLEEMNPKAKKDDLEEILG